MRLPAALSQFATAAKLAICALSMMMVAPASAQSLDGKTEAALDTALAGAHRSADDKARDSHRNPKQTLAFFGLRHDMTVVEMWPGGGWYTDILAPTLAAEGRLYTAHFDVNSMLRFGRRSLGGFLTKLAEKPELYRAVRVTPLDHPATGPVAPAGSADLVLIFRNVHSWLRGYFDDVDFATLAFEQAYLALKPGGVLGVVQHRWPDPETEDETTASTGYVSQAKVIALAEAAGFQLAGSSEINANPKDAHVHPKGVWTLPPRLAMGDVDRAKYQAIGESDRMTLKFVKPAP